MSRFSRKFLATTALVGSLALSGLMASPADAMLRDETPAATADAGKVSFPDDASSSQLDFSDATTSRAASPERPPRSGTADSRGASTRMTDGAASPDLQGANTPITAEAQADEAGADHSADVDVRPESGPGVSDMFDMGPSAAGNDDNHVRSGNTGPLVRTHQGRFRVSDDEVELVHRGDILELGDAPVQGANPRNQTIGGAASASSDMPSDSDDDEELVREDSDTSTGINVYYVGAELSPGALGFDD